MLEPLQCGPCNKCRRQAEVMWSARSSPPNKEQRHQAEFRAVHEASQSEDDPRWSKCRNGQCNRAGTWRFNGRVFPGAERYDHDERRDSLLLSDPGQTTPKSYAYGTRIPDRRSRGLGLVFGMSCRSVPFHSSEIDGVYTKSTSDWQGDAATNGTSFQLFTRVVQLVFDVRHSMLRAHKVVRQQLASAPSYSKGRFDSNVLLHH